MRKTVVGAILLLAMIAIASASAQDVCRDLPDGSLAPGSTATVTLTVTVDGADFYAIDEVLPAGWEIVDAGGGNTADPGHIKWIALQNAEDTTYTYQVRVPEGAAEGTYTFSGDFQMQGMDNPAPISCDSSVEVQVETVQVPPPEGMNVCRDLPDGSLAPGSTATVTLTVTVDGADFYAIDEVLPAGWEIVDAGGGNTADPGHIKWIALQNAEDTTYTYQVRVPEGAAEGTYTFSGDFQMQGMDNPAPISCDSSVEVAEGPQPTIAQPSKGDMLSGMATIVEVDESGRNITYNLFEYYPDLNCDGKANDGAGWVEIYNDTNGDDGWSAEWDTVTVPDGCYIIRATMGDDEGLTGSDQTSVIACNPPEPSIPNPGDGASVAGTITIEAVDDSGQNDVVKSVFEYAPAADTTWTLIGEDTDGSDGWSVDWNASGVEDGEYLIRATMYDTCSSAEETITITVVSGSIVLHPGWNLISVVCGLDNSSVDHVLEGIDYEAVISYNACNGGWESVTDIEPLKAYWIKVESMQVITNLECGASVPPSMQLCEGWNIIGHLLKSPASAETTLFMIDESYDRIWVWNAEEQTHDLYGYNCNVWPYPCPPLVSGEHVTTEDFVMQPHAGYWIHVTSETTLEALES